VLSVTVGSPRAMEGKVKPLAQGSENLTSFYAEWIKYDTHDAGCLSALVMLLQLSLKLWL